MTHIWHFLLNNKTTDPKTYFMVQLRFLNGNLTQGHQCSWFIILCCCLILVSCNNNGERKITIAAAANMQFVMTELVNNFSEKNNVECDLIIGSSGKITAQITEGAPYDVFVAANMKYPEFVYSKGLSNRPPQVYGYGKLVLWSADASIDPSLDLLLDESVETIAIANPQTAPYGEAAMQVLRNNNLLDSIGSKLVFGESIAQTNQFIVAQAATVGFTALSVVLSDTMKNKGKWIVLSEEDYRPISQGALLISRDKKVNDKAEQFYTYLFSKEAADILEEFGYSKYE